MSQHPITTTSAGKHKRAARIAIAAIACIPLIYGGALIWANQDPTHRLDKIPAAVIDLDQPVTQNGTKVDVGASVAHDLVSDHSNDDFDWTETDARAASAGLKDGTYLATVTLPKDMSANAASLGTKPADAAASQVKITTDDGRNYIVGVAAKTIGLTISQSASKSVSQQYLTQIYSGLNQVSSQLTTAASGAKQLASGAGTLKSGTAQLASGAGTLQSGAAQVAAGAGQSASGAAELASGLGAAQTGANRLASGTAQVAAGTSQLSGQTAQAASGAQQVSAANSKLASGAQSLATADSKLASGASSLSSGLGQLQAQTAGLPASASALATGAGTLSQGLDRYAGGVNQLADSCATLASTGATTVDPIAGSLCSGINQVAGAKDGSGYANSTALTSGAQQLAAGTSQLSAAAPKLAAGVSQAASGAQSLASGAQQAASGAATLNSGAQQTARGAQQLATKLTSGESSAAALNSGAQQAATGARQLASKLQGASAGASALARGTAQVASGATSVASGANTLASGSQSVDAGAGTLATGSGTLANKLTSGAKAVPSYTAGEQKHLSQVAAQPIALAQSKLHGVPSYGYGLSPYFLALGAWVGGLSIYMLLRAIPQSAIERDRPGWLAALLGYLRGAWISVVQVALLYLVVTLGIGVHAAHPVGLALFLALTGLAFTAVNHALMVLFGSRGRFLGLILLVLQVAAAGATYPIETTPRFFQFVHGILPMTYAANAIRSLIAGGGAGVAHGIVVMACWLIVALLISIGVTTARRARRSAILLPDFAI